MSNATERRAVRRRNRDLAADACPVSAFGGGTGEPWSYSGHLTGFVILYDRDEDGEYEAIGNLWTAAWRRRGIARRLLQEARSRFGARDIERPYTEDGAAFVRACAESSG